MKRKLRQLTRGEKVQVIIMRLDDFFKGKFEKTNAWLRTENPLLGNIRPWDMIEAGREDKLFKFIKNQLEENKKL